MKYSQEWWVDLGKFLVRLVTYDSPSKILVCSGNRIRDGSWRMASIDMMKPPMIPGHKKSVICLGTCRFGSANYGITPAICQ